MGFDPLSSLLDIGNKLIDKLIPDPAAKAKAKFDLLDMQQKGDLAQLASDTGLMQGQLDINKVEAANSNLFVSGWRPFIGWVCGVSFAYATVGQPLITFFSQWVVEHRIVPPVVDTAVMLQVLLGLLGLGIMRTVEKKNGSVGIEPGH